MPRPVASCPNNQGICRRNSPRKAYSCLPGMESNGNIAVKPALCLLGQLSASCHQMEHGCRQVRAAARQNVGQWASILPTGNANVCTFWDRKVSGSWTLTHYQGHPSTPLWAQCLVSLGVSSLAAPIPSRLLFSFLLYLLIRLPASCTHIFSFRLFLS